MKEDKASYSFTVNRAVSYVGLIFLCILEFFVLLMAFFWWLFVFWNQGSISLIVSISLIIVLPIFTFYSLRKKTTERITVFLSPSEMEIQYPSKSLLIRFADVESYGASSTRVETYNRETISIHIKHGKKIRLTATSDICDIKPMALFREKFEELAQTLQLEKKNTWEERMLT